MRVFENRVLGRIVGPKRDEVREEWSRLHTEALNDLYSSPESFGDQIEKNEIGGTSITKWGEDT
jgi:hypothetical protein